MPRDLFEEAGINPNEDNSPRDLFAEAGIDPNSDLMDKLKYSTGLGRDAIDQVRDLAAGAVGGVVHGGELLGKGLMQIPGLKTAARYYHNKLIPDSMTVSDQDTNDFVNKLASPNKSIGGNLLQGIGSYLPYAIAGGPSMLGQMGAGAMSGAAEATPDQKNLLGFLPNGSTGGAMEGALVNALIPGVMSGINKLRPSNLFRGQLSPEELAKNVDITKGTETGLGDVVGSPFLKKRLENTLTSTPFSGANESLQRTGQVVKEKGENLLSDLLGDQDPHNVPRAVSDALTKTFKEHLDNKNSLYNEFNDLADNSGIKLELPTFAKKANDYSEAISSTNLLKTEPDMAKIFNKLQNYKNPVKLENIKGAIVDKEGKPLIDETINTYPTFQEANLLKGKLNQIANTAAKSPDPSQRNMAKVYGDLARSLKTDIQGSISEHPDISGAYENAENNYKKNFSPFLDRDIYKYVSGNADPETIVSKFIKTSPSQDLAAQLAKLATKLPDQQKNLLGYSYLSRALDNEGNLNPTKLSTAINKLGHNQLKALFPDAKMRNNLLNYSKLAHMNTEANSLMFNPKTGQRNTDALMTLLLGTTGHMLSGDLGAIGATLPVVGAGKLMTKYLTNPLTREALIQKMIENKQWDNPELVKALQVGTQGLMNQNK